MNSALYGIMTLALIWKVPESPGLKGKKGKKKVGKKKKK